MKITKRVSTTYISDEGFSFTFEPVEDTVSIKETPGGYEARYLVQDNDCESPEEWENDGLFLVGYHRDFTVDRGSCALETIFRKEEFKKDNGYNGRAYADGYGWKSYAEAKKEGLINKQVRRGKYTPGISKDLACAISENDGIVKEEYNEKKEQINRDACWGFYGQDNALKALETDI